MKPMISKMKIEQKSLNDLTPYDKNARTHSDGQISQIVNSVTEWGWTNPVIIDETGLILAGHGRFEAAKRMNMAKIPAVVVRDWTDAQKRAYTIADNKLALNADWDDGLLAMELGDLNEMAFDLDLIGFDSDEIASLLEGVDISDEADNEYSRKIESPVYEVTGERPPVDSLVDSEKASSLIAKIDGAEIPDDVAEFLRTAAQRHSVFDYEKIAEFYAHAEPEVQSLMEESALIIIDFDQAIDHGYVRLSEQLIETFGDNTE